MKSAKKTDSQASQIEDIEEATELLRRIGVKAWLCWFAGTLPFLCALLHFWNDMSRAAAARERIGSSALGLALLFVFMKVMHSLFSDALLRHLKDQREAEPFSWKAWLRLVASQALIHSTMPWMLLLSLIAMLPFAWVYAFYQNVTALSISVLCKGGRMRNVVLLAINQSHFQPLRNHGMMFLLFLFQVTVFMNLFIGLILMATLSTSISGSDSFLTRSPWALVSTAVLASLVCLVYLLTGPMVQSVYALRCFRGVARRTGEDLLVQFRRAGKASLVMLLLCCGLTPTMGSAQSAAPAPERVEQLKESIRDVMQEDDFQWRLPRDVSKEAEKGWIAEFMQVINQSIYDATQAVGKWLERNLIDWLKENLKDLFGGKESQAQASDEATTWADAVQPIMWVLLILLCGALCFLLYKQWRMLPPKIATAPAVAPDINLESDAVLATQLPESEWMKLAREKMETGDYRLSMRALFLATLAHLGEKRLIAISRWKSNGDYKRELHMRARDSGALREAFDGNVRVFDGAWYGWHEVSREVLERFMEGHNCIIADGTQR